MNKVSSLLALLALALVGCNSSGTPGAAASGLPAPKGLPDELKNDAYAYYGLGNEKPVRLEVSYGPGLPTQEATRQTSFVKAEGGKATFVQKQTGALANEGDITFSLEKDGIYVMESSRNKVKPHSLEMPAKLEVGGGWEDHTEMTQGDQEIKLDNTLKIVGKERVATPGGTFDDALHVTSTGKGTLGGRAVTLNTQHWYVLGIGPVKQVVEVIGKDAPKQMVTVQLAAPEKAPGAPATPAPSAPATGAPKG
jgi:hypothetical protein